MVTSQSVLRARSWRADGDSGDEPRIDPFRVLSSEQRAAQRAAYLEILERRNGPQAFPQLSLPRRERRIRELERAAVRWRGPLDRPAARDRYLHGTRAVLGRREQWLCAAARSNEDEAWAVAGEIERYRRRGAEGVDPVELFILLEEDSHGRMMHEALRILDVEMPLRRPRWFVRLPIRLMQHLPPRFRYIGILCGELVGCALFEALRDTTHWFADEPEVQQRLWQICNDILCDEALHVVHCRLRLGPVALGMARWLVLPLMACVTMLEVRGLPDLGLTARSLLAGIRRGVPVPPGLAWSERHR